MLVANNIGKDDEIITTPYTFAATSNVIMLQKAKPIFVDIEPESYNIDPLKIEEKITEKTKAIMLIHYAGQSSEMNKIMNLGKTHNLHIFEDAAPAAGAVYHGKKVGGIGDAGAFSFFPDKNMTTGEGGMLTTNSDDLADKARILKKHGASSRYYHTEIGWNFKLSDINAALGLSQLKKLPLILKEKQKLAENYTELIEDNLKDYVIVPKIKPNCTHTFNMYNIKFKTEKIRNKVKSFLEEKKIETRICFPPIHLQPVYQKLLNYKEGDFPISEESSKTTLCLPMIYSLSLDMQEKIVYYIKDVIMK